MIDKSNYICTVPFKYTEVFDDRQFLCCPSWLNVDINNGQGIKSSFYSDKAKEVRESIIDGSYKYCSEDQCPYLKNLIFGKGDQGQFIIKSNTSLRYIEENTALKVVNMCFDRSCNLQCPSCRVELINYLGKERESVEIKLSELTNDIGKSIRRLYLSGSADPFYSKSFRQFLINFDLIKFPKLRSIHLHTNGLLWTSSLWSKMNKVHKFINTCEISIDAATKETYENKTRIGGNWDTLLRNIKFIKNIPTLRKITLSFVVQQSNYKEVKMFYDTFNKLIGPTDKKITFFFNKITNWGTFSEEQFKKEDISNIDHPEYPQFIELFKQVHNLKNVTHNISIPELEFKDKSII